MSGEGGSKRGRKKRGKEERAIEKGGTEVDWDISLIYSI